MKEESALNQLPSSPAGKVAWPWTEERPQLPATMPNGEPWPRITVVTPSYNQCEFLEETIRSVLMQGYPNLEYILMDGGSTDGSLEIIEKYSEWFDHWVSQRDDGQAAAINQGWQEATGDIVAYLNSDDVFHDGALAQVALTFSKHAAAKIIVGDCTVIDELGKVILVKRPEGYTRETLLLGRSLPQPSVFLQRSVLEEVGYMDTNLHFTLDWAYFLKILSHYPMDALIYIPEILSMSREYLGTKSTTGLSRTTSERRKVLSDYSQQGILGKLDGTIWRKAWVATYWLQVRQELAAGHYGAFLRSVSVAAMLDPLGFLSRIYQRFLAKIR